MTPWERQGYRIPEPWRNSPGSPRGSMAALARRFRSQQTVSAMQIGTQCSILRGNEAQSGSARPWRNGRHDRVRGPKHRRHEPHTARRDRNRIRGGRALFAARRRRTLERLPAHRHRARDGVPERGQPAYHSRRPPSAMGIDRRLGRHHRTFMPPPSTADQPRADVTGFESVASSAGFVIEWGTLAAASANGLRETLMVVARAARQPGARRSAIIGNRPHRDRGARAAVAAIPTRDPRPTRRRTTRAKPGPRNSSQSPCSTGGSRSAAPGSRGSSRRPKGTPCPARNTGDATIRASTPGG